MNKEYIKAEADKYATKETNEYEKEHPFPVDFPYDTKLRILNLFKAQVKKDFTSGSEWRGKILNSFLKWYVKTDWMNPENNPDEWQQLNKVPPKLDDHGEWQCFIGEVITTDDLVNIFIDEELKKLNNE